MEAYFDNTPMVYGFLIGAVLATLFFWQMETGYKKTRKALQERLAHLPPEQRMLQLAMELSQLRRGTKGERAGLAILMACVLGVVGYLIWSYLSLPY